VLGEQELSPEPVIVVEGLAKSYGPQRVLTDLSFHVEPAEVFCILGPNGSGKTTTLSILQGFVGADAGHVRVLSQDPSGQPVELRRRVGVVLQEGGFPNFLRVGEIIEAWRSYYDHPLPYDEIIDLVELRAEETKLVRRLSGGQRRRLEFALAVAGDPDLMFLDEPTTGFDPESRARCWAAINELRAIGKTVVLTTHYLDEAERLADRIAILYEGTIRASGTAPELAAESGLRTHVQAPASWCPPLDNAIYSDDGRTVDGEVDDVYAFMGAVVRDLPPEHRDELRRLRIEPPTLEASYLRILDRVREGSPS
jgi:ABC-2 type transport system ATP-binding protein